MANLEIHGQISVVDGCSPHCGPTAAKIQPILVGCLGTYYNEVVSTDVPLSVNSPAEFIDVPLLDQIQNLEFLYVFANAPITYRFGGNIPELIGGQNGAAPGVFPTGFVGGETLECKNNDFPPVTVTFTAADQSAAQCANAIDAAFALASQSERPGFVASGSGQLGLRGFATGEETTVEVLGGTAQVALGFGDPNVIARGSGDDILVYGLGMWEFGKDNPQTKVQIRGVASQLTILAAGSAA